MSDNACLTLSDPRPHSKRMGARGVQDIKTTLNQVPTHASHAKGSGLGQSAEAPLLWWPRAKCSGPRVSAFAIKTKAKGSGQSHSH